MTSGVKDASVEELLEVAKDIVDEVSNRSTIFDPALEASLPRFEERELSLGRVLGRGGFCVVKEITKIRPGDASMYSSSWSSTRGNNKGSGPLKELADSSIEGSSGRYTLSSRKSLFSHARSRSSSRMLEDDAHSSSTLEEATREFVINTANRSSRSRYALKRVSEEKKDGNKEMFLKGCIDLALEAKFLSSLSHPSILDIRAVSSVGPFDDGYFIIVDLLKETLPKRISRWMTIDRQTKGVTGIFAGGKTKVDKLYIERLMVAYDIASAVGYLHELRVIYRDLKPENIGFLKSRAKIFDFGLAKELNEDERTEDGMYRMTGMTGSVRYLAPEIGLGKPYNEKADVYSFGILFWYMMALEPPFGLNTERMILDRVPKGHRPVIMNAWPEGAKNILNKCWSTEATARPDFQTVMKMLKEEVAAVNPDKCDNMIHHSAKLRVEPSETVVTIDP